MERSLEDKIDGWMISLKRNIHMYTHELTISKGSQSYSIDCEDLPSNEKTIGIWLYTLNVSSKIMEQLKALLLKWASNCDICFQIYTAKNSYVSSK